MSLQNDLVAIAKTLKVNFTLNDQMMSYEEVFKDTGMLRLWPNEPISSVRCAWVMVLVFLLMKRLSPGLVRELFLMM